MEMWSGFNSTNHNIIYVQSKIAGGVKVLSQPLLHMGFCIYTELVTHKKRLDNISNAIL